MPDFLTYFLQNFQSWYGSSSDPQAIVFLFASLIACFIVLTKGADFLVDGAAGLAGSLGVPKIIIGATVVALGTTLPEVTASVIASLQGDGGMAAGNSVGSIICNAGLVFGLCCFITRLPVNRFTLNRNAWFQIGGVVLLFVLYMFSSQAVADDGTKIRMFGRGFGIILLIGLLAYTLLSVKWAKQSMAANNQQNGSQAGGGKTGRPVVLTIVGFVLVIVAAQGLVTVIRELALKLGVPTHVVSVTLLALGTSIPEFATGLMSIIKGHKELLVGNIIGANILNVFFVFGASATVRPLAVPHRFLWLNFPVMLLIIGLFHLNIWTSKKQLSRWPSLGMLILYLAFVVVSYVLKG